MSRSSPPIEISVVVPVYRCATCLHALVDRTTHALSALKTSFEIILVDDASPDGDWELIQEIVDVKPTVRGLRLSRNFGQHAAITAGIAASRGSWIAVIDCDLQDPPEMLAELYSAAGDGIDIVIGHRRTRTETIARRLVSRMFFSILGALGEAPIKGGDSSLSIMSRKVADVYLGIRDYDRHHAMILRWLGFRTKTVEYDQLPRISGNTSYSFGALLDSAIQGVLFHSTKLLRLWVYFGFVMAFFSLVLIVIFVVLHVIRQPPPGWTSLVVLLLMIGGVIIVSVGTVGLYVSRIFDQVRGRPLYVVAETKETSAEESVGKPDFEGERHRWKKQ